MADTTHISWADRTWSPWTGCARVSPACDGCYAAHLMDARMHRVEWGEPGTGEGTRDLMSDAYWRKPLAWDRKAARTGAPSWVFPSLCDPFDTAVPAPWRWRFVELMEATPHLLWLLLTKRIGNVVKLTDPCRGERPLPSNHALGSTFANQEEWDRDYLKLANAAFVTGPAFTFGSFEPLLGLVDMGDGWCPDWVIVGGETDQGAHRARFMRPSWARSLRDQAEKRGKTFHFKQWGSWSPHAPLGCRAEPMWGAEPNYYHPWHVGARAAGRTLDGVIHDARPSMGERT